jgi:hypothetical protein
VISRSTCAPAVTVTTSCSTVSTTENPTGSPSNSIRHSMTGFPESVSTTDTESVPIRIEVCARVHVRGEQILERGPDVLIGVGVRGGKSRGVGECSRAPGWTRLSRWAGRPRKPRGPHCPCPQPPTWRPDHRRRCRRSPATAAPTKAVGATSATRSLRTCVASLLPSAALRGRFP